VIERRQQLGLALEASHALRIMCHGRKKHFQSNFAFENGVPGAVYLTHAARTERC
jgi:hypothetical protein